MTMVSALHQIEITSRCQLRCAYCPSPNLARPKVDMTEEHFARALEHAERFYRAGTQVELNLAGIGESTLHPLFPDFILQARLALPKIKLTFATNGLVLALLSEFSDVKPSQQAERAHAERILEALLRSKGPGRTEVWVSQHRPEKAGLAVTVLADAGLLVGVSNDPAINADNWAGQVRWKRSFVSPQECMWLRDRRVFAMADGRITTCCLDASGAGVIGHLSDDADAWESRPFELCKTCQYAVPKGMGA